MNIQLPNDSIHTVTSLCLCSFWCLNVITWFLFPRILRDMTYHMTCFLVLAPQSSNHTHLFQISSSIRIHTSNLCSLWSFACSAWLLALLSLYLCVRSILVLTLIKLSSLLCQVLRLLNAWTFARFWHRLCLCPLGWSTLPRNWHLHPSPCNTVAITFLYSVSFTHIREESFSCLGNTTCING